MKQLAVVGSDSVLFAYKTAVDKVQEFRNVQTPLGRFRLLVRFCLVYKCLHVPVQQIVSSMNFFDDWVQIVLVLGRE